MVDRSSSKRCVSIRFRLAVFKGKSIIYKKKNLYLIFIYSIYRVSNLIGKELPCRGSRCRIVADLARQ